MPEQKTVAEETEFQGKPTLTISELDENEKKKPYPFSFGKKKAKLIIKHIEAIKKFAEQ